ncbi:DUF5689 domain-containing protein [Pedobacter sp.]|uniref:DUF5689 domain-containing protein n=1 Tax=Pedobacter sp. TaxID=1411316 RepID=UPI003D7F8DFD
MKKIFLNTIALITFSITLMACKKTTEAEGTLSPIIAISDLRGLFKGNDIPLNPETMFGARQIVGIVISDHTEGNAPSGLLVLQNNRRAKVRGIAIPIGEAAASYMPGDSIMVNVDGGTLKRVNGMLQITGINNSQVTKVSSANVLLAKRVTSNLIVANPDTYESTLVAITKAGFDPLPAPTDVFSGDRLLNDGFDNIMMHTQSAAAFAKSPLPVSANFTGIILGALGEADKIVPRLWVRKSEDVKTLSSVISISPIIITGFMGDARGSDGNYEYLQFMATRDIDFAVTPFSVVTTNNAGASTPTGYPAKGWATGGLRTYKFNLTTGKAAKGTYFYVGGTAKKISGSASTDISAANWITAFNYSTNDGQGFGTKTTGLLANSGNAAGFAVFEGTNITVDSKPLDVIFFGGNGNLFSAGPPSMGYRITTTDFYDEKDLITLVDQPYFANGSNTLKFAFTLGEAQPTHAYFGMLGGVYNANLGKWTKVRALLNVTVTDEATLADLEGKGATMIN